MKPLKLAAKLRGQALRALWASDIDPKAVDAAQQLKALSDAVISAEALFNAITDAVTRQSDETGAVSGDDGTVTAAP